MDPLSEDKVTESVIDPKSVSEFQSNPDKADTDWKDKFPLPSVAMT